MPIGPRPSTFHALGLVLGLALLGGGLHSESANATTAVVYTFEQQVDAAEHIVQGEVLDVWTELDANGLVWTRALVEVSRVLKGPQVDTLVISDAGGTYGTVRAHVGGATAFGVGEEIIAFGSVRGQGRVQLVGLSRGKMTVRLDPLTRREIVQNWAPPGSLPYDHRFIPPPADGQQVFLDDYLDSIQARVELGWDGKPIVGVPTERLLRVNRLQPGVK